MNKPIKLLHTSDWHLGRPLCGRRRYHEFEAFLKWLLDLIVQEKIDVLLVAGDVFDSIAPAARAQTLYYQFLGRVASTTDCGQVVIIAGNHDSPALLSAPKEILRPLDIHVIGQISQDGQDEVIVLNDQSGQPRLIVAAVPHPRDQDLRQALAGENTEDKERKLAEAIANHYQTVGNLAMARREAIGRPIPIIALGHLFAAGGQTLDGDGVRRLYIGSLGQVSANIFPPCFDYLALGHLHQPQMVASHPAHRYSGSPLAMTFAEAGRPKSVFTVTLDDGQTRIQTINVPVFQRIEQIKGDWDKILTTLQQLKDEQTPVWLEIEYTGEEIMGDLRSQVETLTHGSNLEVLRLKNHRVSAQCLGDQATEESLDDLNEDEVFRRCLEAHRVPDEQRPELIAAYDEIVRELREGAA